MTLMKSVGGGRFASLGYGIGTAREKERQLSLGRCGSQKRGLGGAEGGRGEADLACDVARHRRGGEAEPWCRVAQEEEAKRDVAWMRCGGDAGGGCGGVRCERGEERCKRGESMRVGRRSSAMRERRGGERCGRGGGAGE
uniref:Uncharacterized protein n=1 Tax=Oryza rufipogon TaxID=4529 RepID=A0A0E0PJB1_ORYRU